MYGHLWNYNWLHYLHLHPCKLIIAGLDRNYTGNPLTLLPVLRRLGNNLMGYTWNLMSIMQNWSTFHPWTVCAKYGSNNFWLGGRNVYEKTTNGKKINSEFLSKSYKIIPSFPCQSELLILNIYLEAHCGIYVAVKVFITPNFGTRTHRCTCWISANMQKKKKNCTNLCSFANQKATITK